MVRLRAEQAKQAEQDEAREQARTEARERLKAARTGQGG